MESLIHYVCTGTCRGVSEELKMCGAVDCPQHNKPLTPCNCADGMHTQAQDAE